MQAREVAIIATEVRKVLAKQESLPIIQLESFLFNLPRLGSKAAKKMTADLRMIRKSAVLPN